jgi:hypothetical protein
MRIGTRLTSRVERSTLRAKARIVTTAAGLQGDSISGGNMRIVLNVVGAILVFFGGVWFLQGINVLPGSFMTGQIKWAVYGGIAVAVGVIVLIWANRKKKAA